MKRFDLFLYFLLWHRTTGFLSCSIRRPSFFGSLSVVKEPSSATEIEEDLSDTDSRVLESMLQDSKLDLETEADIRKLLERGTVKKVSAPQKEEEATESDYTSTILKTLGDTKLWKKLSTQASDVFESVSIWIGNKVEQDVKTLAALGFFAWERAVRDVGRALPQAGELSKKTVFLLTNSSSAGDDTATQRGIKDRMLRPQDEIQSVSREIRGILSGQQRSSSGRNLRTIAPAGSSNNAERLRRAYQQSRRADRDAKDLTRVPGKVVDGAWELRRELTAETNEPGYKSKPIRNAIAAGVANTGNLLQSVREQARLAASKRKEERLLSLEGEIGIPSAASRIEDRVRASSPETKYTRNQDIIDPYVAARREFEKASQQAEAKKPRDNIDVLEVLRGERKRILKQLASCIDTPSKTWLVGFAGYDDEMKDTLINVVTKMVVLRNDVEEREEFDDEQSAELVLSHLREIKESIDEILQAAESSLSPSIIQALESELYHSGTADGELSLILQLNEIESPEELCSLLQRQRGFIFEPRAVHMTPPIIDVITETPSTPLYQTTEFNDESLTEQYDSFVMPIAEVEVVVDDDIFDAADRAKKTVEVTDSEENQEESEVVKLALRSLDVIFFVVEKALFAAIPHAITLSTTAFRRAKAVNELGRGSRGWEQFSKLGNTRAKY
ncbi:hypothetical protein FisN_25Lh213 [Fistulifera solaris]|uniref:Uncharacterized protein n=1 Tax=Fistulifera solaris TaxID=1519565 RepID=A0A1Z5KQY5_FISSO|nr:hypothetical protein FisN_25Lh213 [Fistulifera solaris]|eukprot:GAX28734.1 hypothetical protein FisN_25Lh213 [Fistulifera solaris]